MPSDNLQTSLLRQDSREIGASKLSIRQIFAVREAETACTKTALCHE